MRTAVAYVAFITCAQVATATSARASDLRLSVGVDALIANAPDNAPKGTPALTDAEMGISARLDWRGVGGRWDFRLDFQGREGFIGNSTRNQLIELSAGVHLLNDRLKITLGRIRTPGGFWLIVDGVRVDIKYTRIFGQSAWGGLRSFTTGRRDTWMVSNQAAYLPVVGTGLWLNHRLVNAQVSFSWAHDAIDLPLAKIEDRRGEVLERHIVNEYFLDGSISIFPHPKLSLLAGASLGTRYDVQFNAGDPSGPVTLGTATLGAIGAYGTAEYRPAKNVRLVYTANYEHVRLYQAQLLTTKADGTPVQAADGSFQDHALALRWRIWRALKFEARYRVRYRANTDLEHHIVGGLNADELWKGLGVNGSVGVDLNRLTGKLHQRVVYSAGISFIRTYLDLGVGMQYTDGIGSGLTFSQHNAVGFNGAAPTELFPFVLETNRVAYLRAFGTFWKMYAGVDIEENLEAKQVRALVQIGGVL